MSDRPRRINVRKNYNVREATEMIISDDNDNKSDFDDDLHDPDWSDVASEGRESVLIDELEDQGTVMFDEDRGTVMVDIDQEGTNMVSEYQGTVMVIKDQGTNIVGEDQGTDMVVEDQQIVTNYDIVVMDQNDTVDAQKNADHNYATLTKSALCHCPKEQRLVNNISDE